MKEYIIVINTILQKLQNNDVPQLTYSLHSPQKHPALSLLFNSLKVTTWNPVELPTYLARWLSVRTWNLMELPKYLSRCLRVRTWNWVDLSPYLVRCLSVKTWNWVELSTYLVRCLNVKTWNLMELSTYLSGVWMWQLETQWNCQRVCVWPVSEGETQWKCQRVWTGDEAPCWFLKKQHSFPSTCMKPKSTAACQSSPFSISESWWRFCPDPYPQQWNHQAIAPLAVLAVARWKKAHCHKGLVCFSMTGDLITSCLSGASLAVRCSIFFCVFSTALQFQKYCLQQPALN